ncbi:ATP-dependent zinc protease [Microbacterium sp. NPDC057659]|uniref:ATP-dependent zinc protease family protein n=1 Tax=Microbacterium sp. NPDC057659 TaxID=3346198 RepID=UPI00366EE351
MGRSSHSNTLTGWREWVGLPDLGVAWIKAKIDTGARTSSLHAFDVEEFTRDGAEWVRFRVNPWQDTFADAVRAEYPVHDRREVRSSSGHTETRLVVLLKVRLVDQEVTAEVTLTNRDEMGFRMLVGREALRQGFVVDPARSFLGGRAPKEARRRNRGKDPSTGTVSA